MPRQMAHPITATHPDPTWTPVTRAWHQLVKLTLELENNADMMSSSLHALIWDGIPDEIHPETILNSRLRHERDLVADLLYAHIMPLRKKLLEAAADVHDYHENTAEKE